MDIATQRNVRKDGHKLPHKYGTHDRILRYKHLKEYFYIDTRFATRTSEKSSRGNTCARLFVTDNGYVHAVPMTKQSDILQAIRQFINTIGVPDCIICDASKAQKSTVVRHYCDDIGTILRVLERNTPLVNKSERYIRIFKESMQKDLKESNYTLAFWYYCIDRKARINNITANTMFILLVIHAHP